MSRRAAARATEREPAVPRGAPGAPAEALDRRYILVLQTNIEQGSVKSSPLTA